MTQLNKDIILQWADELESGRHKQGFGVLRRECGDVVEECCLGVLCDLPFVKSVVGGTWHKGPLTSLTYATVREAAVRETAVTVLPRVVSNLVGLKRAGEYVLADGSYYMYQFEDEIKSLMSLGTANDCGISFSSIARALRTLVAEVVPNEVVPNEIASNEEVLNVE